MNSELEQTGLKNFSILEKLPVSTRSAPIEILYYVLAILVLFYTFTSGFANLSAEQGVTQQSFNLILNVILYSLMLVASFAFLAAGGAFGGLRINFGLKSKLRDYLVLGLVGFFLMLVVSTAASALQESSQAPASTVYAVVASLSITNFFTFILTVVLVSALFALLEELFFAKVLTLVARFNAGDSAFVKGFKAVAFVVLVFVVIHVPSYIATLNANYEVYSQAINSDQNALPCSAGAYYNFNVGACMPVPPAANSPAFYSILFFSLVNLAFLRLIASVFGVYFNALVISFLIHAFWNVYAVTIATLNNWGYALIGLLLAALFVVIWWVFENDQLASNRPIVV